MAKRQLRQLESCSPGHAAPDFEGDDLDGKKLKLKDYRGKVVLLVFWGSWCGPCLNDVPHEKELVEKFKDRPFEIIGINFDDDLKEANLAVKTHAITWRSLADKKACVVKASENYVYSALPTVYVIDHEGIIRENKLRGKDLDEPLEKLVVEAEKANKEKKK